MKKYCLLFILFLITVSANAQQFGGTSPSIKWQQVNTPAAKVIFPAGMDSTGLRVANIIQRLNPAIQSTIGNKQRQVSILLQNQTVISNGYVGLAPFRSEFYLTPLQNSFELGSLPWADQLAIHEFRHVQQYNNFNVGLSKAAHVVFGEGGQAIANAIAIPDWFFEGDAVFNETHVSQQGRGRLPEFLNGYRALWSARKDYSWMKLRNGSLVDYVPSHYPLGYMMVAYGREKYGDQFWKNVTHDAASYKGLFYPLQKAVKTYSGEDYKQFRLDGLKYFKQQFTTDILSNQSQIQLFTNSLIKKNQHFVADQEYPAYVNDSTIIYVKTTYKQRPVFVLDEAGKERDIKVRSVSLDNYFSYVKGKIVYAAYRPDTRWNYRDYSELRLLDVHTGKERWLTSRSKYFSPALSEDGKTIVAVHIPPAGKSELHILYAENGQLISVVPNQDNLFYTYPKFYKKGQLVAAVRNAKGQMTFALIDIKTGNYRELLPFSYEPVAFPIVNDDKVYFSKTNGLYDQLYSVDVERDRIESYSTGDANQYQPAIIKNKLAWVELTAYGYQIQQKQLAPLNIATINTGYPIKLSNFQISALQKDTATSLLAKVVDKQLPVTKYNKAYHLFNFHSLVPEFDDPNYRFALVGENVLNTFQSQLSFNYNRAEGYKQLGFDAVYGALFPYISAGVNYTLDRKGYYNGSNIFWNESDIHAGLRVPLNLSRGRLLTNLSIGSDVHYSMTSFQQAFRSQFQDRNYTYLNNSLTFSTRIQQAKQNIFPHLGQSLTINYKTAVDGLNAKQFLASGTFYLPGIFANHSLVVNAAYQQKARGNVISFSNNFPFSRGYTAENLYQQKKIGVNYHFPIIYPDAGVANTLYFLRVRGNLFYDHTDVTDFYTINTKFKANFNSTGAEVFFDTKWFNQQPVTFGIRYSYLMDRDLFGGRGPNRIELVLPVSFL